MMISWTFQVGITYKYHLREDAVLTGGSEVVYVGDSTGEAVFRSLSKMRPAGSIEAFYHTALTSEAYFHFVRKILRSKKLPKLVVLPINLITFAPSQYLHPGNQYHELMLKVRFSHNPILFATIRFLDLFKIASWLDPLSREKYDQIAIKNEHNNLGIIKDVFKRASWAINFFMPVVHPEHVHLTYFNKTTQLLGKKDIKVLLYFNPMNYEKGDAITGGSFSRTLNKSIAIIEKSLVRAPNLELLNMVFSHGDSSFLDQVHQKDTAARWSARELNDRINIILKKGRM